MRTRYDYKFFYFFNNYLMLWQVKKNKIILPDVRIVLDDSFPVNIYIFFPMSNDRCEDL